MVNSSGGVGGGPPSSGKTPVPGEIPEDGGDRIRYEHQAAVGGAPLSSSANQAGPAEDLGSPTEHPEQLVELALAEGEQAGAPPVSAVELLDAPATALDAESVIIPPLQDNLNTLIFSSLLRRVVGWAERFGIQRSSLGDSDVMRPYYEALAAEDRAARNESSTEFLPSAGIIAAMLDASGRDHAAFQVINNALDAIAKRIGLDFNPDASDDGDKDPPISRAALSPRTARSLIIDEEAYEELKEYLSSSPASLGDGGRLRVAAYCNPGAALAEMQGRYSRVELPAEGMLLIEAKLQLIREQLANDLTGSLTPGSELADFLLENSGHLAYDTALVERESILDDAHNASIEIEGLLNLRDDNSSDIQISRESTNQGLDSSVKITDALGGVLLLDHEPKFESREQTLSRTNTNLQSAAAALSALAGIFPFDDAAIIPDAQAMIKNTQTLKANIDKRIDACSARMRRLCFRLSFLATAEGGRNYHGELLEQEASPLVRNKKPRERFAFYRAELEKLVPVWHGIMGAIRAENARREG